MAQRAHSSTTRPRIDGAPEYRRWLLPISGGALLLGFLAAPWPIAVKAHAAMHGLCAQNPGHSLSLGGAKLPFDARMTGMYFGLAVTIAVLAPRGGLRRAGNPKRGVLAALVAAVAVMAADGFNSLFLDLGVWHPYQPDNRLRLVTGIGAGLALGVMLAYLFGSTLWRRPSMAPVAGWRDLALAAGGSALLGSLALTGWGWLYAPLATLLVVVATGTVCAIALMALLLLRLTSNRCDALGDLRGEGLAGVLIGLALVAALALGRFALERWLGIPTTLA